MSLHIAILGILCEGNRHPYDIKKKLRGMNLENIPHLNDGSLYYNFEALRKKGCIEKLQVTREDNRPNRTTYGITPAGREALEQEIYDSFKNYTSIRGLYASVGFIKHANPAKVAFLVEEIIQKLEETLRRSEGLWDQAHARDIPFDGRAELIYDHASAQMKLEIDWLRKLLAYVRKLEKEIAGENQQEAADI